MLAMRPLRSVLLAHVAGPVLVLCLLAGCHARQVERGATSQAAATPAGMAVEEAVVRVCRPNYGGNTGLGDETQVTFRLTDLRYGDYEFRAEHASAWRALLRDESASVYGRMCAARFLLKVDDADARTFLTRSLDSGNLRHVYNATDALCEYAGDTNVAPWAIEKLVSLIADDRLYSRIKDSNGIPGKREDFPEGDFEDVFTGRLDAVCSRLGDIEAKTAVPALIRVLERHPDSYGAACALGEIGDPAGIPVLMGILKSKTGNQGAEITALGELRASSAVPLLVERLSGAPDKDPFTAYDVARIIDALGNIGDQRAIPALNEWLARPNAEYKAKARLNLALLENEDPVPALLDLSSHETDLHARIDLVWRLANRKDERAIDAITELAQHAPDAWLRYQAIRALGEIGQPRALAALVGVFRADSSNIDPKTAHKLSLQDPLFWPTHVARTLEQATGERLGTDPTAWEKWLAERIGPTSRP